MTFAAASALKPVFILLYAAFGLFCLVMAMRAGRERPDVGLPGRVLPVLLPVVVVILLLEVFAGAGSYLLLAATAIGTGIFALRRAAWTTPLALPWAGAAVALVLTLAWWRIGPDDAATLPLARFAIILAGLAAGFADRGGRGRTATALPMAIFAASGLLLLIDLGAYRPGRAVLQHLAHHWGAFVGPALHLRAGLVPFYDVPLQYGLGPTLAIAASCRGSDCWAGTQAIVIGLDLANAVLLLAMALATALPRGLAWRGAATIVMFAACFLWTAAPAEGNSLLAWPSAGGVRYLPVTLVTFLLFFGRPAAATAALVPAVLWAPESAAMALAVFGLSETARIGLARAALRSAGVLAGSMAGLVLLHHAVFGVWIDPAAFAEYVLHVPGPLPINPFSDVLLLAAVLALGGWLLLRGAPDPVTARRDRTATFLLFAVASFFFGRSHPNNICNLMPFLALVGLRVLDRPDAAHPVLAGVTRFGLAASVAALAMSPWCSVPYRHPVSMDIHAVVANFPSLEPDMERIRRQLNNPGGLGIADFGETDTRHPAETLVWTPMDPGSLWPFVPAERRRLYIRRSVARLGRSGWAIFDAEHGALAEDFRAGYGAVQQRGFDVAGAPPEGAPRHYLAICFDPLPAIVANPVGPACPAGPP